MKFRERTGAVSLSLWDLSVDRIGYPSYVKTAVIWLQMLGHICLSAESRAPEIRILSWSRWWGIVCVCVYAIVNSLA